MSLPPGATGFMIDPVGAGAAVEEAEEETLLELAEVEDLVLVVVGAAEEELDAEEVVGAGAAVEVVEEETLLELAEVDDLVLEVVGTADDELDAEEVVGAGAAVEVALEEEALVEVALVLGAVVLGAVLDDTEEEEVLDAEELLELEAGLKATPTLEFEENGAWELLK